MDATLRWDCRRPTYDKLLRIRYNSQFNDRKPGDDYNKLYYKLHVPIELKKSFGVSAIVVLCIKIW